MTPPPAAALALLGVWVLTVFWVTTAAGAGQARADDRLDSIVPDDRLDELGDVATDRSDDPSFSAADD